MEVQVDRIPPVPWRRLPTLIRIKTGTLSRSPALSRAEGLM